MTPVAAESAPTAAAPPVAATALVAPGWPPATFSNGIVTYVRELRRGMTLRGVRTSVLAIQSPPTPTADDPDVIYLPLRELERRSSASLLGRIRRRLSPVAWHARNMSAALAAATAELPAECGCIEMEETHGWAAGLARHQARPVVIRLHGPWFLVGPAAGARPDREYYQRVTAEGEALRSAAGVIAPSYAVLRAAEAFYGFAPRNATVIPLPIERVEEASRWQPDRARPPQVLFVGRFDRIKGGDLVLQAFARVAYRVKGARLVFVGPDLGVRDERGRLLKFAEYARRVVPPEFAGQIEFRERLSPEAITPLRSAASVCLIASRYETFAYTGLEAMAAGCPLVATRVGGLGEMVMHRSNGLLCDPESADDLAAKLIEVLEHPALAEQLAAQAVRDVAQRNAPERIAALTLEEYRAALARPG